MLDYQIFFWNRLSAFNRTILELKFGNWSEIKDKEDDIYTLQMMIDELVQDIGETSVEIYKLELYLDAVKEGKAKLTTNEETQD